VALVLEESSSWKVNDLPIPKRLPNWASVGQALSFLTIYSRKEK